MVTLKREEQTENRYGGYTTRFADRMQISDRFTRYAENGLFEDSADTQTYAETEYDNYLWEELKRTEPRRITPESEYGRRARVDRTEYVQPTYEARPARRSATRKSGLSLKGKLLILVYAAVVVLFASIIITNAITLDSYNDEITNLEMRLEESQNAYDAVVAGSAIDREEIRDQAISNGMVEATGSVGYEVIPITPPTSYEMNTNWFDRLCDGLSSVFGG